MAIPQLWKIAPNQAFASLNSSVGSIISAFGDVNRSKLSPVVDYIISGAKARTIALFRFPAA